MNKIKSFNIKNLKEPLFNGDLVEIRTKTSNMYSNNLEQNETFLYLIVDAMNKKLFSISEKMLFYYGDEENMLYSVEMDEYDIATIMKWVISSKKVLNGK